MADRPIRWCAERVSWRPRSARSGVAAAMIEIAIGFFIGLIVIISFTGLVFLYPLTFRTTVSQGHLALPTHRPDDGGAPEVVVKEKEKQDNTNVFEYVEAVLIRAVHAKELRLRAEAMARVHSERPHPLDHHPHLRPLLGLLTSGTARRATPPPLRTA